jgi:ADP-heptose:LPS heptosyltransferase
MTREDCTLPVCWERRPAAVDVAALARKQRGLAGGRLAGGCVSARQPERVLVVPFADGIGDFVLMLPLLAAVARRFPAASITVAASGRSALLLDPAATPRVAVRTPRWLERAPGPRGGPFRRLAPQSALARLAGAALRWELGRFDRVLNLFQWWESGMDFARFWTPRQPEPTGAIHTLDFLADRLGAELGRAIGPDERRPVVEASLGAAAWADGWWRTAGLEGRPVVGLAPATNMVIKRWPVECWARLCDGLTAVGWTPLLLLPPGDDPARRIPDLARSRPATVSAPLDRVAALQARCRLVVGVDTGLLHLAAAVGTRYVGLFGPTNPAVTGPYDRRLGRSLVAPFAREAACDGCWRHFKYEDDRCRAMRAGSCMTALPVEAALAACADQMARVDSPIAAP